MKRKVVNARKARTRCPAITYSFLHQAPVYLRRVNNYWGADWASFNKKHGLIQAPGFSNVLAGI